MNNTLVKENATHNYSNTLSSALNLWKGQYDNYVWINPDFLFPWRLVPRWPADEEVLTTLNYINKTTFAWKPMEDGEGYQVTHDIPGFGAEDIEVTVEDDAVTVKATSPGEGKNGTLNLSSTLPNSADVDTLRASVKNGVLTLSVAVKTTTRRIEVTAG